MQQATTPGGRTDGQVLDNIRNENAARQCGREYEKREELAMTPRCSLPLPGIGPGDRAALLRQLQEKCNGLFVKLDPVNGAVRRVKNDAHCSGRIRKVQCALVRTTS